MMWAHRQVSTTDDMKNSLMAAARNSAPSRIPTVAIELMLNRSTTIAMSSQAIPVIRNNHHGIVCVRALTWTIELSPSSGLHCVAGR